MGVNQRLQIWSKTLVIEQSRAKALEVTGDPPEVTKVSPKTSVIEQSRAKVLKVMGNTPHKPE